MRLPLTSVEQYHLADDSRQYPNVIACDLIVSGEVDRDIATIAFRELARQHALTCARLERRRWFRPQWQIEPANADQLHWQVEEGGPQESIALEFIDLDSDFPSQLLWRREGQITRLSFRIHHAAVDGAGGLQVIVDWMVNYQRISLGRDKPKPRAVHPGLLIRRNHLRLFSRESVGKLWLQPVAVLGAAKFLLRHVSPIVPLTVDPRNRDDTMTAGSRLLSRTLDDRQFEQVKQAARESSATVNEKVLEAVFLAIHELRKRHGWHREREWLRLVIPVNIRDFADRRLPASNRATIVQLDRTDRDFADPGGLLWGIHYELDNIRKWNLEKTFLLILKGMSLVPGWIRRAARRPVCRATSVVTNLGAPLDRIGLSKDDKGRLIVGNLVVEDLDLVVPLRPGTPLGFAVAQYGRRQKINLHFDPSRVDLSIAEELLDLAVQHLTTARQPTEPA